MLLLLFFFFNDTATTEIYTLSLHDALPIFMATALGTVKKTALDEFSNPRKAGIIAVDLDAVFFTDRKSTRLNSSHLVISYAVFCLKKKKYIFKTVIL